MADTASSTAAAAATSTAPAPAPAPSLSPRRIASIDIARFLGICLVFYGHFVEQVMYLGNGTAAQHYKWVYSFHMPLFFFLAGSAYNEAKLQEKVRNFVGRTARTRLVPFLAFCGLLALLSLFLPGWFPLAELDSAEGYATSTWNTLRGMPAFNIPLWFLACLVSVEVLHFALGRFWKRTRWKVVAALGCYAVGVWLNRSYDFFGSPYQFWFLHIAVVGYAFYLAGILTRRSAVLSTPLATSLVAGAALLCLLGVHLTYDLNQGPFKPPFEAVVLVTGSFGNVLLFPLTAFLGIGLLLLLGRLLSGVRILERLGQMVILLYCLHGIFYHFVNPPLAAWMAERFPLDGGWLLFWSAAVTVVSVALTLPFAFLLGTYLPWLAGRRRPEPTVKPTAA